MRIGSARVAGVAIAGVLALGLAACSSDSSTDSATPSTSAAAAPTTSAPAATTPSSKAPAAPLASIDSLKGVKTEVVLDSGFVEGITSLGLTPAPVGTATISSAGVASFPITGGNVKYFTPGSVDPYVTGKIMHEGSGISLTGGGTTVELTDFVIDPGTSMLTGKVTANGKVAVESAPLFFLDGSTLKPLAANEADGTAVLEGTQVKLTKAAADLLNQTYKTDALKEFFLVGVAKITISTK